MNINREKLVEKAMKQKGMILFAKNQFDEIKNRKLTIPVTLYRL